MLPGTVPYVQKQRGPFMSKKSDFVSSRRNLLKATATTAAAVTLAGRGGSALGATPPAVDLNSYAPVAFDADEWRFLLSACDRLIPDDETGPGALAANVPIFIDRQMNGDFGHARDWYMEGPFAKDPSPLNGYQSPLTPAEVYHLGIKATDAYCRDKYGKAFADLTPEQRDEVLTGLDNGKITFDDVSAEQFFSFLLQNTKEGFFADPLHGGNKHMIGWAMLGFPGARGAYLEWVDQYNVPYPLGPVSLSGERR
jgi:gluconate 2-dehydrogenase gamma chain